MANHDIAQIASLLAGRVEAVCHWLLPQGKRISQEWQVGSLDGEEGHSLRVNLGSKAGLWTDFADAGNGGDLIDLIMKVKGISKAEAIQAGKEFLGIREDKPSFVTKEKTYARPSIPDGITLPSLEMREFFFQRGIDEHTLNEFGVCEIEKDGRKIIVFPYFTNQMRNEIDFIKFRPVNDKKGMWTSKNSRPCLFGWQTVPDNARTLVITEGEPDAMIVHQALKLSAVSVPRGGGEGDKQDGWIDAEWERLQGFDTIYLALDSDKEGKRAVEHICRRLGQHRCKVVDFGEHKDANQAFLDGANIASFFDLAKTQDPNELKQATEYLEELKEYIEYGEELHGETLPWESTFNNLRLGNGETTIWAGINGHGKSMIAGHVIAHSASNGGKWCIASMEFKPKKMLARLARQICGCSSNMINMDDLFNFLEDRIWIFDVQGNASAQRLLDVFEYAYRRYGVTHFLIDSLAKCGFGEDSYNEQKAFVDKLSDFARDNDIQVHLVCHSRKKAGEDEQPDKFDIKGTGAITDMVDNVFIIWRNKQKEEALQDGKTKVESLPDAILKCCKSRNCGWEGNIKLFYDKMSYQYMETMNAQSINYATGKVAIGSTF